MIAFGGCPASRASRARRSGGKLGKDIGKLGSDGSGGRLARRAGAHDADSLWVALGKLQESPVHTRMKYFSCLLHPITRASTCRPGKAFARVAEHEENGAIGNDAARGERVRTPHEIEGKTAPVGLVGDRRVRETVAEYHRPPLERGANHLADQLGAGSLVHQKLRLTRYLAVFRVEHHRAKRLADARAAGLAQAHNLAPRAAQLVGNVADMG